MIFSDLTLLLVSHRQKTDPKAKIENGMEPLKIPVRKEQTFVSFSEALLHSWKGAKPTLKMKQLHRMTGLFDTLSISPCSSDGQS